MSLRVIKWDSLVQLTLQLLRTWRDHRRALHWLWGQVPWILVAVMVTHNVQLGSHHRGHHHHHSGRCWRVGFFVVLENVSKVLGLSLSPFGSSLSQTISSIVPLSC